MADEAVADAAKPKRSRKGLLIGVAMALVLGGGGFYAVRSGALFGPGAATTADHMPPTLEAMPAVAFVPLDPIIVSLGSEARTDHLRFRAQLEVGQSDEAAVTQLTPRVIDVLNSYLRAVEPAMFDRPGALIELRAQMLRRVGMVVGEGRVRDLLIMEFVLS